MGNYYSVQLGEAEEDILDDEFDFDDEEDDFMERSQRKMLKVKRGRASRRDSDWD